MWEQSLHVSFSSQAVASCASSSLLTPHSFPRCHSWIYYSNRPPPMQPFAFLSLFLTECYFQSECLITHSLCRPMASILVLDSMQKGCLFCVGVFLKTSKRYSPEHTLVSLRSNVLNAFPSLFLKDWILHVFTSLHSPSLTLFVHYCIIWQMTAACRSVE